jgi:hypothetical protein
LAIAPPPFLSRQGEDTMMVKSTAPVRMSLYLQLAAVLLTSARMLVKIGWVSPAVLTGSLKVSNALSRAALRTWRRSKAETIRR